MAKTKDNQTQKVTNRQAYQRLSFLHQASTYFSSLLNAETSVKSQKRHGKAANKVVTDEKHGFPVSSYLGCHLTTIARKGNFRVDKSIKRSICKRCKVSLREGSTSAVSLENKSKDGAKLHADVLLVTCLACGMEKRYPLVKNNNNNE